MFFLPQAAIFVKNNHPLGPVKLRQAVVGN
jgi:hypothetical protein